MRAIPWATDLDQPPGVRAATAQQGRFPMRLNRSVVLAALIALGAAGCVLSGQLRDQPVTAAESTRTDPRPDPTRVHVVTAEARNHVAAVRASGQTAAMWSVEIRAAIEGPDRTNVVYGKSV